MEVCQLLTTNICFCYTMGFIQLKEHLVNFQNTQVNRHYIIVNNTQTHNIHVIHINIKTENQPFFNISRYKFKVNYFGVINEHNFHWIYIRRNSVNNNRNTTGSGSWYCCGAVVSSSLEKEKISIHQLPATQSI